jgi:hypothetical protein
MKNLYKELSQNIKFIIIKLLIYYNRKRIRGLTL